MEQRSVIQFYCKLGKSATEAFEGLKRVCGDECLFCARVFEWFAKFHDGRESIKDDPRPGRPVSIRTEENIEKVRNLVSEDRRITTRMITDMLKINKDTARDI
jgi:histone-lysine N-methyltransferase SETMAR